MLPIEVSLAEDVRSCRTCKWFWGGIMPYGDFPVYDWNEDYPEAVRNQKNTTKKVTKPEMLGKCVGHGQVDPGILHGCRKSPIMTIGINPNMTGFFASTDGARWAYPNFSNTARYGYYYRHHSVYQESLDLDFIRKQVIPETELKAEHPGWLLGVKRTNDHRWALITIRYKGEEKDHEIEVAWTEKEKYAVFVDRVKEMKDDNLSFQAGDLIGARILPEAADDVEIYANSTGYYQRFLYVLEEFREMGGSALKDADFHLPDTVAQHDMIHCASPGWSDAYDIPQDRITQNCVVDHAYLIKQVVQSRPSLIVLVGGSSLAMFGEVFGKYMDLHYLTEDGEMIETYQLLKETVDRKCFLTIRDGDYEWKARIVVSPHFSYYSNFAKQSRFSEKAWTAFSSDFPEDVKVLTDNERVQENTWNDIVPLAIHGLEDSIKKKLSVAAWNVIMAYYYDPIKMLASVLKQEWDDGRLELDASTNRLKRSEGACQFCVNSKWQFPEGCPYGQDKLPQYPNGYLEGLAKRIANGSL